jgi:Conserved TM helix
MNTLTNISNLVGESLAGVLIKVINFLPNLIIAIILIILGWLFGGILGRAAAHLVHVLKIDTALSKAGLSQLLNGVNFSFAKVLGGLIKWIVILSFLMAATQQLGLDTFSAFFWYIIEYIPNVIVAVMILIASFLLADFVAKIVSGSARAADLNGRVAGGIARYSIIIVGVLAGLTQLNIASGFMQILFTGLVAALSLALGLSFGLGGRDAAAKALNKLEDHF